jgi:hypothetical protein
MDGILEGMTASDPTLKFWHGAKRWEGRAELRPSRPKSYECGPGLYLTNHVNTARSYAKGAGQTVLLELAPSVVLLEDATLTLEEMLEGLASLPRVRGRKEIVDGLKKAALRHPSGDLPACYLLNWCVNNDALGGDSGPALARFFVSKGIDASVYSRPGTEDWVVLFNMDKVVRATVMKSNAAWEVGDFPRLREQVAALSAPSAEPTVDPPRRRLKMG